MKRAFVALALSSILASASAGLAPPASAAQGPLAGSWTSTDSDGSNQTLEIRGSGHHVYAMVYYDDSATGACDGSPARIPGRGLVDGDHVLQVGSLICLPGGKKFKVQLGYTYDANTDTLTDDFGIVWHRAS